MAQDMLQMELLKDKEHEEQKCPGSCDALIGCVNYLSETTRPDIRYIVSRLARFRTNPGLVHWNALKKIYTA
jgi:hypothetical protein